MSFVRAVTRIDDFPRDGRPEIAVMGRSNVGKSSLINRVLGRRSFARVSKTPGRTREVHYYLLDDRRYLVDLPGFGYARVGKEMRRQWSRLIEAYLGRKEALALAVHLVDARHDPTPLDAMMRDALLSRGLPTAVVLTKCDKLSGSALPRALSRTRRRLELPREVPLVATSAADGTGIDALSKLMIAAWSGEQAAWSRREDEA
ncbi:MAG: ribosome biogenesis GTP-binding protein YihA/YsxC [Acidobacteriota bacterium]|nr:ribosome biogenesis GTP-binding protein YihA/YsxC [Acidobacteriota bacterium]MDQ7087376.1 ribosome biogenesis GTP-binding protein YihA/YsxC [Acidobacteriota bacterium]